MLNNVPAQLAIAQYLKLFVNFNPEEINAFYQRCSWIEFSKGNLISPINSEVKTLYFILSGVARHYFRNADNEEVTIWISEAGGLSTDYGAFTKGVQTQYEIQAITDVQCVAIDSSQLNELYDQYKNFERLGRLINQQYLNDFIDRNNFLINYSAKERYRILFNQKPHWFNTVPLKHLASYLAVTVETLSRLRSNTY